MQREGPKGKQYRRVEYEKRIEVEKVSRREDKARKRAPTKVNIVVVSARVQGEKKGEAGEEQQRSKLTGELGALKRYLRSEEPDQVGIRGP